MSTLWQSCGEPCPSRSRPTAHTGLGVTGSLHPAIGILRSSHPASICATQASLSLSWTWTKPSPGGLGPARQGRGPDLQGVAGDAEADSGFLPSWTNLSLPHIKGAGVTCSGILELVGEAGTGHSCHIPYQQPTLVLAAGQAWTGLDGGVGSPPTPAGEQWPSVAPCPLGGVRRGSVHPGVVRLGWFCPLPFPTREGEKYPEFTAVRAIGVWGALTSSRPPPGASRHVN